MNNSHAQLSNGKIGSLVSLHGWHIAIARALANVGTPAFISDLLAALATVVPIESAQFALERKGLPPLLIYEQGIPEEVHSSLINRYFSTGYMLDPLCYAVQSGLPQGFYHLSEVAPDDFLSSDYYRRYYLDNGLLEDCYYIVNVAEAKKLTLCFYQGRSGGRFTVQQLEFLRSVEPLVRELMLLSYKLAEAKPGRTGKADAQQVLSRHSISEVFDSLGSVKLTAREKDLAHLILRGHSTKSAANDLGVSVETIRMHRKNLYAKLKINTQAELFAVFITALPP